MSSVVLVALMRSQKHSGPSVSPATGGFKEVGVDHTTFSEHPDCEGKACPGCDIKDRRIRRVRDELRFAAPNPAPRQANDYPAVQHLLIDERPLTIEQSRC